MIFNNNTELDKSWVDIISNLAFIKNTDRSDIANVFLGRKMPSEIFFSFIHEATHHWTFLSSFGSAIYIFNYRAKKNYEELQQLNNNDDSIKKNSIDIKWDIYSDYSKYRFLLDIYRPLIEGIALFAEYDVYPTKTEAIPECFVHASQLFSEIENSRFSQNTYEQIEKSYTNFLVHKRIVSEEGKLRKSNLLTSEASLNKSPYLTGYLFVKNLQQILISINKKFVDSNIFLHFLKEYYFNDFDLMDILFDDKTIDQHISYKLVNHFQYKTRDIAKLSPLVFQEIEDSILGKDLIRGRNIFSTENIYRKSLDNLEKAIEDIGKYKNGTEDWYMRNFFRVSKILCFVVVSNKRIIIAMRYPLSSESNIYMKELLLAGIAKKRKGGIDIIVLSIPNDDGHSEFEGECYFEKYYSYFHFFTEFTVLKLTKSDKTPIIIFPENISKENKQLIKNYYKKFFKSNDKFSKHFFKNIDLHEIVEPIELDHKNNIVSLYQYYLNNSLYCVDSSLEELKEIMEDNGYWDVLNEEEDLINLLSFISLHSVLGPIKKTELNTYGFNINQLHRLNNALKEKGFSILHLKDDYIYARCI